MLRNWFKYEIFRSKKSVSELIELPEYIPLINPSALSFLQKKSSSLGKRIAIEARKEGQLVGLVLITLFSAFSRQKAFYHSFAVKENPPLHFFDRKECAFSLFIETEELLIKEENATSFTLSYIREDPFSEILDEILRALRWPPSKITALRLFFDADAFAPPWLHASFSLPDTMTFFPWKELLSEEREKIAHFVQQGRCLAIVNPLSNEEEIDDQTSMGLRYKGSVVGWSVTARLNASTLCYSKLYVDQIAPVKNFGIALLLESIRRQKELSIPRAFFELNIAYLDQTWRQFVKKRLLPLSDKLEHEKRVEKTIDFLHNSICLRNNRPLA